MKYLSILFVLLILVNKTYAQSILKKDNLMAWCIVPFDANERGPVERIDMLADLGFKQYAYDWREKHLSTFENEIQYSREKGIKIEGVWLWIDKNQDSEMSLSASNLKMIEILKKSNLKADIWVGFAANYFDGYTHKERLRRGIKVLKTLKQTLGSLSSRILLYNHGDWFGEPENQIEIIEKGGFREMGLVYSFHHGHHQYNRFPSLLKNILPYVAVINLNGMDIFQSQILPIGEGKYEKEMIKMIIESGYTGPIGILGHDDTRDVKDVLKTNLSGLAGLQF